MNDFDKSIENIKTQYAKILSKNEVLEKENEHLKSEHYKDDALAAMNESLNMWAKRSRHYGLDDNTYNELMDKWKKHLKTNHKKELNWDKMCLQKQPCTPSYHIRIDEFAECTCYSVVCNKCKKSETVYY